MEIVVYIVLLIGLIIFLVHYLNKKNQKRKKKSIKNCNKIKDCKSGDLGQIKGQVKVIDEDTILIDPVLSTPCVYYKIVVERYNVDDWVFSFQEEKIVPFMMEEGEEEIIVKGNVDDSFEKSQSTVCLVNEVSTFIVNGENKVLDDFLTLNGIIIRPRLTWFGKYYKNRVTIYTIKRNSIISVKGMINEIPSEEGHTDKEFIVNDAFDVVIQN